MRVAAVAGVLGGLCWVGAWWVGALAPVGAVLLAVAALGAGAGLVSRSTQWLRILVAVCFLALVGSVVEVLRENGDDQVVLAVVGVLAAIVGAAVLARHPRGAQRGRGAHAA